MLNLIPYLQYLRDQRGVETLEWILIGGLITGVAIALYPGVLEPGLDAAIDAIVLAIQTEMP